MADGFSAITDFDKRRKKKEHLWRINISMSSISEIISTSIIQQQKNKPFTKINVWSDFIYANANTVHLMDLLMISTFRRRLKCLRVLDSIFQIRTIRVLTDAHKQFLSSQEENRRREKRKEKGKGVKSAFVF